MCNVYGIHAIDKRTVFDECCHWMLTDCMSKDSMMDQTEVLLTLNCVYAEYTSFSWGNIILIL